MDHSRQCPVCGKENSSGRQHCACGNLLQVERADIRQAEPALEATETAFDLNFCLNAERLAGQRVFLEGPWYQPLEVVGSMLFGREADLPPEVRLSLETKYDNISRRHAEIRHEKGEVWVADLGSSNGTFVNDVRLMPNQPVRLIGGAKLRFAADLVLTLRIDTPP